MGVELEIPHGLATLKLNLGEFLAIAQQIAGVTKHREARQALKDAIGDPTQRDTAVDVFTSLHGLTTRPASRRTSEPSMRRSRTRT